MLGRDLLGLRHRLVERGPYRRIVAVVRAGPVDPAVLYTGVAELLSRARRGPRLRVDRRLPAQLTDRRLCVRHAFPGIGAGGRGLFTADDDAELGAALGRRLGAGAPGRMHGKDDTGSEQPAGTDGCIQIDPPRVSDCHVPAWTYSAGSGPVKGFRRRLPAIRRVPTQRARAVAGCAGAWLWRTYWSL